jgi:hypothetical protein
MKAFWTVRQAIQVGGVWQADLPNLPNMMVHIPCDINRLTAGSGIANHVHLISGGVALYSNQSGGGHEHFVVHFGDAWYQWVRSGTAHTHPGLETPDYFMCFVGCSDATYATLIAAPYNVKVMCQIEVEDNLDGTFEVKDMVSTLWTTDERTYWAGFALTYLGITLPASIDRGRRLVMALLGLTLARRPKNDRGYRFYGVVTP